MQKVAPKGLFCGLGARLVGRLPTKRALENGPQSHKKGPRGQCEKWAQGPFLRPCGPIGWKASHQEGSRESGHKAIKKALGATFFIGPKGLFCGLVARFSGTLLMGSLPTNRATRPQKRPLRPLFALAPRAFFMALSPDSLEPSWWEASQPITNRATRP